MLRNLRKMQTNTRCAASDTFLVQKNNNSPSHQGKQPPLVVLQTQAERVGRCLVRERRGRHLNRAWSNGSRAAGGAQRGKI
jgi:hypothetical protein